MAFVDVKFSFNVNTVSFFSGCVVRTKPVTDENRNDVTPDRCLFDVGLAKRKISRAFWIPNEVTFLAMTAKKRPNFLYEIRLFFEVYDQAMEKLSLIFSPQFYMFENIASELEIIVCPKGISAESLLERQRNVPEVKAVLDCGTKYPLTELGAFNNIMSAKYEPIVHHNTLALKISLRMTMQALDQVPESVTFSCQLFSKSREKFLTGFAKFNAYEIHKPATVSNSFPTVTVYRSSDDESKAQNLPEALCVTFDIKSTENMWNITSEHVFFYELENLDQDFHLTSEFFEYGKGRMNLFGTSVFGFELTRPVPKKTIIGFVNGSVCKPCSFFPEPDEESGPCVSKHSVHLVVKKNLSSSPSENNVHRLKYIHSEGYVWNPDVEKDMTALRRFIGGLSHGTQIPNIRIDSKIDPRCAMSHVFLFLSALDLIQTDRIPTHWPWKMFGIGMDEALEKNKLEMDLRIQKFGQLYKNIVKDLTEFRYPGDRAASMDKIFVVIFDLSDSDEAGVSYLFEFEPQIKNALVWNGIPLKRIKVFSPRHTTLDEFVIQVLAEK